MPLAASSTGSYVVGYSSTPLGDRAFPWSRQSGMQSLGTLPGSDYAIASAMSDDGAVGSSTASLLTNQARGSAPSVEPRRPAWKTGLGGFLEKEGFPSSVFSSQVGKHKVLTLRNVGRKPGEAFVKA